MLYKDRFGNLENIDFYKEFIPAVKLHKAVPEVENESSYIQLLKKYID